MASPYVAQSQVKTQLQKRLQPDGMTMPSPTPHLPGPQGMKMPAPTPHLPGPQSPPSVPGPMIPGPSPVPPSTPGPMIPGPTPVPPSVPGPISYNGSNLMAETQTPDAGGPTTMPLEPRVPVSGGFAAPIQAAPGPQSNAFNYESARDDWMRGGYDVSNPDAARRSAAAWAAKHGIPYDGSDTINLPNGGGFIDILGNFGGGQGNGQAIARNWTPAGNNGPNAGGGGGAPGMGGGTPGAAGGGSDFQSQIRKLLMERLQKAGQPITADSPEIKGEMDAAEVGEERLRQQRRAAMAERMAYSGLNAGGAGSGAMESEIASGFEDKGTRLQGVRAQLFGRAIQSQKDEIQSMLSMALQTGDAESARALQLQLAQMDAELRRLGISEGARQFNDQFGRQLGRDREEDRRFDLEFGF